MTRTSPILFDVTRLLTRLRFGAPTGIDRVDLAYADHFLTRGGGNGAVSLTPVGARLLSEDAAQAILTALRARWREAAPDSAPAAARVSRWLAGPPVPPPPELSTPQRPTRLRGAADLALRTLAASRQRDVTRHAPQGAYYLHTSHLRLDRPGLFRWLDRRPDIRPVFFLHDLIPIEFPEYGVPGESGRHRVRLETICRYATAVITNSDAVGESFQLYAERTGLRVPGLIQTAPLGVERVFMSPVHPLPAARPYFVICSTIEARKNHLLVLQIWRDLAHRLPPEEMPALVVVGRRGWESETAIDLLERCEMIRPHVIEAPNLPTMTLASLIAGAQALLMPSFAEGFGIPVAEATALGTPVIASDLPSHREIVRGGAILLDPLDGAAWREAILSACALRTGDRLLMPVADWPTHFRIIEEFLAAA